MSLALILSRGILTGIMGNFYRKRYQRSDDISLKKLLSSMQYLEVPYRIIPYESIIKNKNQRENAPYEDIFKKIAESYYDYKLKKFNKKLDKEEFEKNKNISETERTELFKKQWKVLQNSSKRLKENVIFTYFCIIALIGAVHMSQEGQNLMWDGIFAPENDKHKISFKKVYLIILYMYLLTGLSIYFKQRINLLLVIFPIIIFFLCVYNSKDRLEKLADPINMFLIQPFNKITSTVIKPVVDVGEINEIKKTEEIQHTIYNFIIFLILFVLFYNFYEIFSIVINISTVDRKYAVYIVTIQYIIMAIFFFLGAGLIYSFIIFLSGKDVDRLNGDDETNNDYFDSFTSIILIFIIVIQILLTLAYLVIGILDVSGNLESKREFVKTRLFSKGPLDRTREVANFFKSQARESISLN